MRENETVMLNPDYTAFCKLVVGDRYSYLRKQIYNEGLSRTITLLKWCVNTEISFQHETSLEVGKMFRKLLS